MSEVLPFLSRALSASTFLNRLRDDTLFDLFGDSRTADVHTTIINIDSADNRWGLSGNSWFNWGNMMAGCPVRLGKSFSKSGARPDQITNLFMDQLLASPAGWVIVGYPIVNALAHAINGFDDETPQRQRVTLANVAIWAFNLVTANIRRMLAAGKKVLAIAEPGATNLPADGVKAMHEFNVMYRAWCEQTPGVSWLDFNAALWDATASDSLVRFKANVLRPGDPTHCGPFGGHAAGKLFRDWLLRKFPFRPNPMASDHDRYGVHGRQHARNPVFARLTGGTIVGTTGNITVDGNVPRDMTVRASQPGTTLKITSSPQADGVGNEVFCEATAGSTATQVRLELAGPHVNVWDLTDISELGIELNVVSNPGGANIYNEIQMNTDRGTRDAWALWAVGMGIGPTEPYKLRLQTEPTVPLPGSVTKGYQACLFLVEIPAAQTVKFGLSRHFWHRKQLPLAA